MPTPGGERPTFGPPPARSVSSPGRQSRVGVGGGARGALGSPQKSGVQPLCAAGLACRHSESTRLCPNPTPHTQVPTPRRDSVSPRLLAGLPGRGGSQGWGVRPALSRVGSGAPGSRCTPRAPHSSGAGSGSGSGRAREEEKAPPRPAPPRPQGATWGASVGPGRSPRRGSPRRLRPL